MSTSEVAEAGIGNGALGGPDELKRNQSFHGFLLGTLLLAVAAWILTLVSQAIVTNQIGNASVGTLWFSFLVQLLLILLIALPLISGARASLQATFTASVASPPVFTPPRLQVSVLASISTTFSIIGADANLYSSPPSQKALAAGCLVTAIVDLLWILYFTSGPLEEEVGDRVAHDNNFAGGVHTSSTPHLGTLPTFGSGFGLDLGFSSLVTRSRSKKLRKARPTSQAHSERSSTHRQSIPIVASKEEAFGHTPGTRKSGSGFGSAEGSRTSASLDGNGMEIEMHPHRLSVVQEQGQDSPATDAPIIHNRDGIKNRYGSPTSEPLNAPTIPSGGGSAATLGKDRRAMSIDGSEAHSGDGRDRDRSGAVNPTIGSSSPTTSAQSPRARVASSHDPETQKRRSAGVWSSYTPPPSALGVGAGTGGNEDEGTSAATLGLSAAERGDLGKERRREGVGDGNNGVGDGGGGLEVQRDEVGGRESGSTLPLNLSKTKGTQSAGVGADADTSGHTERKGESTEDAEPPLEEGVYRAKALYTYQASPHDPNELSFRKGDILHITDKSGKWWEARDFKNGRDGIVPSNYLQIM